MPVGNYDHEYWMRDVSCYIVRDFIYPGNKKPRFPGAIYNLNSTRITYTLPVSAAHPS